MGTGFFFGRGWGSGLASSSSQIDRMEEMSETDSFGSLGVTLLERLEGREGGREGGSEQGREGGSEQGREGGREGVME